MANLVAMNIKRKDAEVASHGFSIFLDPKRIQLQDAAEIPEMMEEEKPLADAPPANVNPTVFMPPLPTQGQEVAVHDSTMSTESAGRTSEPSFAADQAAPMDVEEDVRQCQPQPQPGHHTQFWSGFF